jgi:hypothetical protein
MKKIIACFLIAPSIACAHFMSGNDLLRDMNGGSVNRGLALGYVLGVTDALYSIVVCPPTNITAGQLTDIIRKHLEDNPGSRHYSADSIIANKLTAMWPCQSGRGV